MKCVAVIACLVAFATAAPTFSDVVEEIEFAQEEASPSLTSAVSFLQNVAPGNVKYHVARVAKHAELLQSHEFKAKAYAHNFESSRAAIKAALNSLNNELNNGHNHDKNALSKEKSRLNASTSESRTKGKTAVHGYRAKVCPEKRAEEVAEAKEAAALTKLNKVKSDKVCAPALGATWSDMDVEKTTPKFGTELRNAWDKARNRWVLAKAEHDKAAKEAKEAKQKREKAMASFSTSLSLEASNAHNACKNAAKEYATLCNEVQSNVKTRKQTFIATLVITCYIDNLTNNGGAKSCADKARSANTAKWDISCGATESCPGVNHWKNSWGPASWQPTKDNCKTATPSKTIKSDGSAKRPHCSWGSWCKWTAATQANCATGLCKASGYKGGSYVSASNDMCKRSFVTGRHHFYQINKDNAGGKVVHGGHANDAQITAKCF